MENIKKYWYWYLLGALAAFGVIGFFAGWFKKSDETNEVGRRSGTPLSPGELSILNGLAATLRAIEDSGTSSRDDKMSQLQTAVDHAEEQLKNSGSIGTFKCPNGTCPCWKWNGSINFKFCRAKCC